MKLYPWQHDEWNQLQQRVLQKRLPHGLIFSGTAGIGKKHFAKRLAEVLLCEFKNGCGTCKLCLLFNAGNHPDFILVEPEEGGKQIKIDQIRELNDKAFQTAQQGGNQIIVIDPADGMNTNASNALLKTLEEPPKNTFIILITNRLSLLMPTIRSRCQIVSFATPDKQSSLAWLQEKNIPSDAAHLLLMLSSHAPLKAQSFYEENFLDTRKQLIESWLDFSRKKVDIIALSSQWQKLDLNMLLFNFSTWVSDLIKIKQLGVNVEIMNDDFKSTFQKLSEFCSLDKMHALLTEINKTKNLMVNNSSLNAQLLIEQILIQWKDVLAL
jgi:DNA polymerase-3 subunit delta'